MLWLIWLIWAVGVLSAGSSVSGSIIVPLIVSVGKAFQLLRSNIVVGVFGEWVSPSISNLSKSLWLLSSDIMHWSIWLIWGEGFQSASTSVGSSIIVPFSVSVS